MSHLRNIEDSLEKSLDYVNLLRAYENLQEQFEYLVGQNTILKEQIVNMGSDLERWSFVKFTYQFTDEEVDKEMAQREAEDEAEEKAYEHRTTTNFSK